MCLVYGTVCGEDDCLLGMGEEEKKVLIEVDLVDTS